MLTCIMQLYTNRSARWKVLYRYTYVPRYFSLRTYAANNCFCRSHNVDGATITIYSVFLHTMNVPIWQLQWMFPHEALMNQSERDCSIGIEEHIIGMKIQIDWTGTSRLDSSIFSFRRSAQNVPLASSSSQQNEMLAMLRQRVNVGN